MPNGPDPLGKRALYWAPAQRLEDEPDREPAAGSEGRRALFSAPAARAEPSVPSPEVGLFAWVDVECSSCDSRRRVDLVEFAGLHAPVFLWRPGRGFTRWMRCPSCGRRTWVSASWASWPR
jgi:hypothetical protein